jgi:hypothetical protein
MNFKINSIFKTYFRNETLEILMSDGLMIPSKEQLNAIGIVAEEFIENEQVEIPKLFLNIWMDFLQFCNEKSLIQILFQKLVETYKLEMEYSHGRMNDLRNKFLLSWIICLVKLNSFKNGIIKS